MLTVANQAAKIGGKPAGMWVLDVSDFDRVSKAKTLDDLKLSFYDTSGPESRGVHNLWFVDGEFAHLTTGAADFPPTHVNDDQFWVTVDLRNPRQPREVGRWWLPGTRRGDACLPGCLPPRHAPFDNGYRPHQIEIWPDHADRAYVAYIDGGGMIFDISGIGGGEGREGAHLYPEAARPGRVPPALHRVDAHLPAGVRPQDGMGGRRSDLRQLQGHAEAGVAGGHSGGDAPGDHRHGAAARRRRRCCAHVAAASAPTTSIPNFPGPLYRRLENTTVSTWFNGGVRIYRMTPPVKGVPDVPPQIEEIGFYIPEAPPRNPTKTIQLNHAIVDERGIDLHERQVRRRACTSCGTPEPSRWTEASIRHRGLGGSQITTGFYVVR